jgi:hypothetical protein
VFRSTRRRRGIAALVQLSLAFAVAPASADVEGIRLTYSGADLDCPDEGRFFQAVTARTDLVRRAAEGEPARAFVVSITRDASGIRGALSITGLDGSVSKREVTGESCNEVVSALALITALAIDPLASTAPESSVVAAAPSSSAAASDVAPATPPSDAPRPAGPSIGLVAPIAQPSAREPGALDHAAESPSPQAPSAPAHPSRWAVGVEGQSLAGLVHGWGVGGGGFFDVTGTAHGHLIPSLRASFFAVTTRVTFSGSVGAKLDWYVARMEACPIRFVGSSDLGLSLCAALDVGMLRSTGVGLQSDGTQLRPWLAPALLGRFGWSPADALVLEAGAGPTIPITRYSFYFEQSGLSEAPLQRILPVAATLEVDAGYRLP